MVDGVVARANTLLPQLRAVAGQFVHKGPHRAIGVKTTSWDVSTSLVLSKFDKQPLKSEKDSPTA